MLNHTSVTLACWRKSRQMTYFFASCQIYSLLANWWTASVSVVQHMMSCMLAHDDVADGVQVYPQLCCTGTGECGREDAIWAELAGGPEPPCVWGERDAPSKDPPTGAGRTQGPHTTPPHTTHLHTTSHAPHTPHPHTQSDITKCVLIN